MSWYQYIDKRYKEGLAVGIFPQHCEGFFEGVIVYVQNGDTIDFFDTILKTRIKIEKPAGGGKPLMDVWELTDEEVDEIEKWFENSISEGYWELIPNTPDNKQCWEYRG